MEITTKSPSCLPCYYTAKRVLFKYRKTHEQVRVWANYQRNARVSGPAKQPGEKPVCATCRGKLVNLSFVQWARLTKPRVSSQSD